MCTLGGWSPLIRVMLMKYGEDLVSIYEANTTYCLTKLAIVTELSHMLEEC